MWFVEASLTPPPVQAVQLAAVAPTEPSAVEKPFAQGVHERAPVA